MLTKENKILILILTFGQLFSFGQIKPSGDTCSIGIQKAQQTFTVPEINAEYPGGTKKMKEYLDQNVIKKVSISSSELEIFQTPVVQWVVDENGKVAQATIIKSSNISKVDKLFLDAIKNMPTWKPAENQNIKIKQDFRLPLKICFK